ncbi:indole-3-glycerol phosphate synthase TrpC [Sediminibacterium sp. KACHI17]|uniref:indole-3-glycerol-phosphate synthase n=1 Tax=Sediminibacterium sp. KACHI17 TaxID=1751071 RepID=A0AAT9GFB5_9BACT
MNILDTIVAKKRMEVLAAKDKISVEALTQQTFFSRPTLSLSSFLGDETRTGIIAEFKRKSPSKGIINASASVEEVTAAYATAASGISVLTDTDFFGGSVGDLQRARIQQVPILRKDFMIDAYQVYEAKAMGADVILLIAACLTPAAVNQLGACAKGLGLEVLLEIHDETELDHISDMVDMVGVNNRNLKTFEVDINTSLQLIKQIPAGKTAIAESGISNVDTIVTLREAGFSGFLIGENFMKEPHPSIAFADFVNQLKAR